jgi:hypothetical protein
MVVPLLKGQIIYLTIILCYMSKKT